VEKYQTDAVRALSGLYHSWKEFLGKFICEQFEEYGYKTKLSAHLDAHIYLLHHTVNALHNAHLADHEREGVLDILKYIASPWGDLQVIDSRLRAYANIDHEARDNLVLFIGDQHPPTRLSLFLGCLLNSTDDLAAMPREDLPLVQDYDYPTLRTILVASENNIVEVYNCYLKHALGNDGRFLSLSVEEIEKRVKEGWEEWKRNTSGR